MAKYRFKTIHLLSTIVCAALNGVAQTVIDPLDTISESISLKEVEIVAHRKLPIMEMQQSPGSFRLGAEALSYTPALLGSPDPIRIMQSLPAVSSSDCISGGIYVQGCESAHNRVNIDGIEIYNPMHLLGLFSVFNASHFESFDISINPSPILSSNYVGAGITANTTWYHPTHTDGDISVGLIESQGTIKIPISHQRTSLVLSGRGTYVDAIFKDNIKIENAPLKYGFKDWNLSFLQSLGYDWKLKIVGFYGNDHMGVKDPNYLSNINLGWDNLAVGTIFKQHDKQTHIFSYNYFSNKACFEYSDIKKDMPSSVYSFAYSGFVDLKLIKLGASTVYRHMLPQTSASTDADTLFTKSSFEGNIVATIPISIKNNLQILPEVNVAIYNAHSFTGIYFLPSLTVNYKSHAGFSIDATVCRRAQFYHKVEESAIGFPTDFWIIADKRNQPLKSTNYLLSLQGSAFNGNANWYIGGYYKTFSNLIDWTGNLFCMLESNYEPLTHVVSGDGRSYGISAMIQGSISTVRGWISYTWSKSKQKFNEISNKWYPYSHDRTHDLKINLTWKIRQNLTLSSIFTYATGNPYTEAKYGYMLGENLIMEFNEHNSSRLPNLHRLDLGLNWMFNSTSRCKHSLIFSLYNAYGHSNVMFKSFTYNAVEGLTPTQWDLGFVLPSISYNLKF